MLRSRILPALALFLLASPARAQLPHARLDRIFPLGGSAGWVSSS